MNAIHAPRIAWRNRVSGEPALADILNDPIVRLVMRKDRVSVESLRDLLERVRTGLANRVCCRSAIAA